MRVKFQLFISIGIATLVFTSMFLVTSQIQFANAQTEVVDILGGADPRLANGTIRRFDQGNGRMEWGYWNADYGYTILGWVTVGEGNVVYYDLPEDSPVTVEQLRQIVAISHPDLAQVAPPAPVVRPTPTIEAPVDLLGGAIPELTDGFLRSYDLGNGYTQWSFRSAEHGSHVLGWTQFDEAGYPVYSVPETGLVSVEQLREILPLSGPPDDLLLRADSSLTGGALLARRTGATYVEWAYWSEDLGHILLGWTWFNSRKWARGEVTPEDLACTAGPESPITAEELCEIVEQQAGGFDRVMNILFGGEED